MYKSHWTTCSTVVVPLGPNVHIRLLFRLFFRLSFFEDHRSLGLAGVLYESGWIRSPFRIAHCWWGVASFWGGCFLSFLSYFLLNLISCGSLEESSFFARAPPAKRRPRTQFPSDVGYSLNKPQALGHSHVFLCDITSCVWGFEATFLLSCGFKIDLDWLGRVDVIINPSRVPLRSELEIDQNLDVFFFFLFFRVFVANEMCLAIFVLKSLFFLCCLLFFFLPRHCPVNLKVHVGTDLCSVIFTRVLLWKKKKETSSTIPKS